MSKDLPRDDIAAIRTRKRELRSQSRQRRDLLSADARTSARDAVARNSLEEILRLSPRVVSGYSAIGCELELGPLLQALSRHGVTISLPVVIGKGQPLVFRTVETTTRLASATWGILEPDAAALEVSPDLLLVPLLAFDRKGRRLGYGGGFYDRTLSRLRRSGPVVALGAAYAMQEVEDVPVTPEDETMDGVITEAGLRRFAA